MRGWGDGVNKLVLLDLFNSNLKTTLKAGERLKGFESEPLPFNPSPLTFLDIVPNG